jgi:hypothetical protein
MAVEGVDLQQRQQSLRAMQLVLLKRQAVQWEALAVVGCI